MVGFTGLKYDGIPWIKDRYAPGDGDITFTSEDWVIKPQKMAKGYTTVGAEALEEAYEAAKWGAQEPDMLLISPEYWNKMKKTLYNITFVREDLVVHSDEEFVDGQGEW